MRSKMRVPAAGSAAWSLALMVISAALCGCNHQSAAQALDEQFAKNHEFKKGPVARFAGTVKIDGQMPDLGAKLFVILTDFQHLDANAHVDTPKLYQGCDSKGAFAFATYDRADGVPAGKYVVTFVELNDTNAVTGTTVASRDFRAKRTISGAQSFRPPDLLRNLYNDPEKNSKNPLFVLDLNQAGKKDFNFELAVAGQDGVAAAPNAVTSIRTPH